MTTASTFDKALNDRYAVRREIGTGGMATVFLARDAKHERDVAIKVPFTSVRKRDAARSSSPGSG